ncbi:MAG: TraB/GumN family protein, partial [Bacteroidota bacterium]
PMFLTVMAGEDMSSFGQAGGDMVSYEMEIMTLAKEKDLSIGGLETAAYQMSMFDSIPYDVQAKMLVDAIDGKGESGAGEFDELVKLYKTQNIRAMVNLMGEDPEGLGKYENLLLANRNKNWIPVMAEMMLKQPTFFAVGAGHLAGKEGVVTLLREEGYEVKPLYQ